MPLLFPFSFLVCPAILPHQTLLEYGLFLVFQLDLLFLMDITFELRDYIPIFHYILPFLLTHHKQGHHDILHDHQTNQNYLYMLEYYLQFQLGQVLCSKELQLLLQGYNHSFHYILFFLSNHHTEDCHYILHDYQTNLHYLYMLEFDLRLLLVLFLALVLQQLLL